MKKTTVIKEPIYEIQGDKALLRVFSKKGKEVLAYLDEDDLSRVKSFGKWQTQWRNEGYEVLCRTEIEGRPIKMPLAAFILGVGHNAPTHHKNGDRLDFRKANLSIFERKDRNAYLLQDRHEVHLLLLDRYGRQEATVYLDDADAARLQEAGHIWTLKRKKNGQPLVVAQSEQDTIPLQGFLMEPGPKEYVHFINKNPLDCRRQNLELKNKEKEQALV